MIFSHPKKTKWMFEQISHDPWLQSIVTDLQDFGYKIDYTLFGNAGTYTPQSIETNNDVTPEFCELFAKQMQNKEHLAQFRLSYRFGKSIMLHTFIHELIHFYQDMTGLLLTPLIREPIVQPDLRSHIKITLLCEAMAATEAIRASYRLKELSHLHAWNGAFFSPNWHGLSKHYIRNIKMGMQEPDAAQSMFNRWFHDPQRHFYERHAFQSYTNYNQEHRNVRVDKVIQNCIKNKKFNYLNGLKYNFNVDYKHSNNPKWEDITIGSPVYIWKTHLAKN